LAIVDLVKYVHLITFPWQASPLHKNSKTHYAFRRATYRKDGYKGKDKRIWMHRVILDLKDGDKREPDHRNGNGLDNRRSNLRLATHSQNVANTGPYSTSTSGFKGITKHGGRWRARTYKNGKRIIVGDYGTPEEAARAYDKFVRKIHGEFAKPNFP
jgi:hypothetical protein